MKDAKGKSIPAWARYVEIIEPATAFAGYKDSKKDLIPFALYCAEDATITFTPIENGSSLEMTLLAGYHPIAIGTINTSDVAVQALFAYKPVDA